MSARWFLFLNTVALLSVDYFLAPKPLVKALIAAILFFISYFII